MGRAEGHEEEEKSQTKRGGQEWQEREEEVAEMKTKESFISVPS